ncbi:MAG: hypothetical protein QOD08_417 [Gaiellaceae bacterium]|jgi:hypothetical protein|nr:hypothetical protein [Gaiellaceae bacterium]
MDGYTVVTSDDAKVGHVVGEVGENLIVELGHVMKSRHPLPRAFAHADDDAQTVRTTVSKSILQESPKVKADGSDLDELEVGRYYGLASGDPAPETLGDGVLVPDDPARSVEVDREVAGMPAPEEERVALRENLEGGETVGPPSPGLLGERAPDDSA